MARRRGFIQRGNRSVRETYPHTASTLSSVISGTYRSTEMPPPGATPTARRHEEGPKSSSLRTLPSVARIVLVRRRHPLVFRHESFL